jgi:P-type Mg2+ transporter
VLRWCCGSPGKLAYLVAAVIHCLDHQNRHPFFKSKPGLSLDLATLFVVLGTLALPYTKLGRLLGVTPMPFGFLVVLVVILFLYIVTAEAVKRMFYQRFRF